LPNLPNYSRAKQVYDIIKNEECSKLTICQKLNWSYTKGRLWVNQAINILSEIGFMLVEDERNQTYYSIYPHPINNELYNQYFQGGTNE